MPPHPCRVLLLLLAVALPCPAGDKLSWRRTSAVPAPEANQAAAADRVHLYAIGNEVIAKYDRATGKRLSVSKGPAKHLNSGFFFEGKLYCAHSNYPRTPEMSEIKVLDPKTMELATFKDFGNYGGSLTWVLRRGEDWWCNFAKYGDDNSKTFLVQFDTAFKEKARYTYPAEVIKELGRYSLSGGVWHEGHLLCTGHDDRVLFRLRLPKEGTVLELVDKHNAPFTGQGIAHDPKTGGLVGIDRAKKEVILAEWRK